MLKNILVGRNRTVPRQSWRKEEWIDGYMQDVTPSPNRTYTRDTWPPRDRGRGESLTSPRRIKAKLRAVEVLKLRFHDEMTWQQIANALGFKCASGAYRAYRRLVDRADWDKARARELWLEQVGLTEREVEKLLLDMELEIEEWQEEKRRAKKQRVS